MKFKAYKLEGGFWKEIDITTLTVTEACSGPYVVKNELKYYTNNRDVALKLQDKQVFSLKAVFDKLQKDFGIRTDSIKTLLNIYWAKTILGAEIVTDINKPTGKTEQGNVQPPESISI